MKLLPCFFVLSFSLAVFAQDAAPEPAADAASYVSKLDELWKARDSADSGKQNDDVIRTALKAFPNDYEILWRAARIRWWVADGVTEEKMKRQVAKEGWNFAKRAVDVKPQGAEGKYYTAINIGAYSQAVGILKAIGDGLEKQFVENLDFSLKANETFDRSGGHTAKGRYYWELPWPKRDLGKSKIELEKGIAQHPEHLRNYYFLADTLLKDGDAKAAKVAIDKALNGSADFDPAEARRIKSWAKPLADKINQELK